jgi:hypothetical protein
MEEEQVGNNQHGVDESGVSMEGSSLGPENRAAASHRKMNRKDEETEWNRGRWGEERGRTGRMYLSRVFSAGSISSWQTWIRIGS